MTTQELKKRLWETADKLRAQMDAAEYKHIVLGMIFLKYVSDSFDARRETIRAEVSDPENDRYLESDSDRQEALEERDYYVEENVFWVPASARWEAVRDQAKQARIGEILDQALVDIETENPALKNVLDKRFARTQLPPEKLGSLIDLVSTMGFGDKDGEKDLLGDVYQYFLGQFAGAEGKKGGQFYTPRSVVRMLVEILAPHHGRIYDPCCGSGGMFVSSEDFVEAHGGRNHDVSIYGQESNPTTWRLAAMNLVMRHMGFKLGKEPGDTFTNDQHPDLKADYVLANPPFNVSDWWSAKLEGDPRWVYGQPPQGNANFAWLQHIVHHLRPAGQAGVVLANGSLTSNIGGESDIRRKMVQADVVECIVALPSQLFTTTQIPVCLWFLTRDKTAHGRDRRGEVLFIDARHIGYMRERVLRDFRNEDFERVAGTVHRWRNDEEIAAGEYDGAYMDVPGFCRSVKVDEIATHDFVLSPGRYVGSMEVEDDEEAFAEKMDRLTSCLALQMSRGLELDNKIREQLGALGYAL